MRILELPDMLRKYSVEPVLVAGWETRGKEFPTRPLGVLRHWTAGGLRQGIPSLQILTQGRSDLPGPLCAVGQERGPGTRDDLAYVIASGKANHAGDGNLNGITGNYKLLGLEIEWAPQLNEGFSDRRRDVSERIIAALSECCQNYSWGDAGEHREYALPAGRKIDTYLPGDELRDRVLALRAGEPTKLSALAALNEEDNQMEKPYTVMKGDAAAPWFVTDGVTKQWINGRAHAGLLILNYGAGAHVKNTSMSDVDKIEPHIWPQSAVDSIRLVGIVK